MFVVVFNQVRLGKNGVEEVLGLGHLSDFEKKGLESLMPELKSSIEKGVGLLTRDRHEIVVLIFAVFMHFIFCVYYCC